MMRGAEMLFAALFAVVFLRRKCGRVGKSVAVPVAATVTAAAHWFDSSGVAANRWLCSLVAGRLVLHASAAEPSGCIRAHGASQPTAHHSPRCITAHGASEPTAPPPIFSIPCHHCPLHFPLSCALQAEQLSLWWHCMLCAGHYPGWCEQHAVRCVPSLAQYCGCLATSSGSMNS